MERGFGLHGDEERWVRGEAECGRVLPLQVQCHGFAEIANGFIQAGALSDDGDLPALGDVPGLFARTNRGLDRVLHEPILALTGAVGKSE